MEIAFTVFIVFGILFLIIAVAVSNNKATFPLILAGITLILVSNNIIKKASEGNPAPSLRVLVNDGKYEVVTIYQKYIIIKSAIDDELKFIGPLDFGTRTITIGGYVKTAEESLMKIE